MFSYAWTACIASDIDLQQRVFYQHLVVFPSDYSCHSRISLFRQEIWNSAASRTPDVARCVQPDMVFYNAGTDILAGDPLGRMNISAQGIASRDAAVFEAARATGVPVCMLLSGGYAKRNYAVIAASLENLAKEFQLFGPG